LSVIAKQLSSITTEGFGVIGRWRPTLVEKCSCGIPSLLI